MRITKKLIAKTCLPVYYEVMEKGKDLEKDEFLRILEYNYCHAGICCLFDSVTDTSFYVYSFNPLKNKKGNMYLHKPPMWCDTKSDMLKCIQVRIDLLESWLKQK